MIYVRRALFSTISALILAPIIAVAQTETDDFAKFTKGLVSGMRNSCMQRCAAIEGGATCHASCDCLVETLPQRIDFSSLADTPPENRSRETVVQFFQAHQVEMAETMQACGVKAQ